ncbi:carboxypeptidase-like regulatory domain-containing protein [Sphingobacterium sp. KU25419]|nr:carboxypeptidase-like regulatory domain-containing protein [Sphingobacterium sp. KU25419]
MKYTIKTFAFAMAVAALFPMAVHAQNSTQLFGKTYNESGALVSGVTLTISSSKQATTSNISGEFTFPEAIIFPMVIHASAIGYIDQKITLSASNWNAKKGLSLVLIKDNRTWMRC